MCERALKSPTYLKRREVKREERIPSPLVWYMSLWFDGRACVLRSLYYTRMWKVSHYLWSICFPIFIANSK